MSASDKTIVHHGYVDGQWTECGLDAFTYQSKIRVACVPKHKLYLDERWCLRCVAIRTAKHA